MPTVRINAELSSEELLEAAEQLSTAELDEFVERVMSLHAKRRASNLSRKESELLLKINEGVPESIQQRLDELRKRLQAETITPEEREELLRLINQVENIDAQRVKHLTELAQLRGISVRALMGELGITTPDYV